MRSLERRIVKLEQGQVDKRQHIIFVHQGKTKEESLARHIKHYPEAAGSTNLIYFISCVPEPGPVPAGL